MRSQSWRSSLRHLSKNHACAEPRQLWHSSSPRPSGSQASNPPVPLRIRDQSRGLATTTGEGEDGSQKPATKPEKPIPRSSLRRKETSTSSGIPPPPPIPGWFLKYNVRLQAEENKQPISQDSKALVLQDPYDDAVLLTIPFLVPDKLQNAGLRIPPDLASLMEKQKLQGAKARQNTQEVDFFSPRNLLARPTHQQKADETGAESKPVPDEQPLAKNADAHAGTPVAIPSVQNQRSAGVQEQTSKESMQETLSLPRHAQPLDEATWALLQGQLLVRSTLQTAARGDKKGLPRNLVVFAPDHTAHDELDRFVEDTADLANADIVRIDASDIAELAGDYIDPIENGPGSISGLAYDAYEGGKASNSFDTTSSPEPDIVESSAANEPREDFDLANASSNPMESLGANLDRLREGRKRLEQALSGHHIVGVSFGLGLQNLMQQRAMARAESKSEPTEVVADLDRWQRLKLKVFFEDLLTAPSLKRDADLGSVRDNFVREKFADIKAAIKHPDRRRELRDADEQVRRNLTERYGRKKLAMDSLRLRLAGHIEVLFGNDMPAATVVQEHTPDPQANISATSDGTIIHLRDIHLIYETPHGEDIVKILVDAVQKRQKKGEPIMIIGTSAEFSSDVATPIEEMEDDELDKEEGFLRLQYNPAVGGSRSAAIKSGIPSLKDNLPPGLLTPIYPVEPGYRRLLELNLRNIQDLIGRLGIECSERFFSETTRSFLYAPGTQMLGNSALTPSQIQKIVLAADGFRSLYTTSTALEMPHLAIALCIIDALEKQNDLTRAASIAGQQTTQNQYHGSVAGEERPPGEARKKDAKEQRKVNLDELRRFASKHEQRLFGGIADPSNIKTTYNDVHVAPETIDALKTVTTLSLLRPDAFSYGVLANDRLPGLLLYGPPGTGKTLLAKAVAKDASATVLEISGAQVYEKYVGEGEKMVRSVFSLAKRLSPCVVFIDEADALFGSRGQNSNRTTHREIINQFLREWDGMDDHSVFMMVATNRPFDLDDAVLRRLPRKILVDLPTVKDRESIFKIHLKGETLDEAVSLAALAEQTPFYSGSDLKNVCVAAALAAVKEENELQLKHKDNKEFKLPAKRTLTKDHFAKALQEISASISEDMSSLNAIKKFDERYGDRRGRRKKQGYGFGAADLKVDESAARVRGDSDQPRP